MDRTTIQSITILNFFKLAKYYSESCQLHKVQIKVIQFVEFGHLNLAKKRIELLEDYLWAKSKNYLQ